MQLKHLQLRQRGRAEVDFIIGLARGSKSVKAAAAAEINERVADRSLPEDLDERGELMDSLLSDAKAFKATEVFTEWHSRYHGVAAMNAFDEIGSALTDELDSYDEGPASLDENPDLVIPAYWQDVEFHRTAGGWDGHPYQGCVHGEIVHRRIVEAIYPGGIFVQRRKVAASATKEHYRQILDMGCSTGHFTEALAETYPDAQITGVDISLRALQQARRVANANGWSWQLLRRKAEDTQLPAGSFDLVASYILLHEIPADIIVQVFQEAWRVMTPGADFVFSDVPRFYDMEPLQEWQADRNARVGGEPHWRSSALLNVAQAAEDIGFINVNVDAGYPYVIRGTKPNE